MSDKIKKIKVIKLVDLAKILAVSRVTVWSKVKDGKFKEIKELSSKKRKFFDVKKIEKQLGVEIPKNLIEEKEVFKKSRKKKQKEKLSKEINKECLKLPDIQKIEYSEEKNNDSCKSVIKCEFTGDCKVFKIPD